MCRAALHTVYQHLLKKYIIFFRDVFISFRDKRKRGGRAPWRDCTWVACSTNWANGRQLTSYLNLLEGRYLPPSLCIINKGFTTEPCEANLSFSSFRCCLTSFISIVMLGGCACFQFSLKKKKCDHFGHRCNMWPSEGKANPVRTKDLYLDTFGKAWPLRDEDNASAKCFSSQNQIKPWQNIEK